MVTGQKQISRPSFEAFTQAPKTSLSYRCVRGLITMALMFGHVFDAELMVATNQENPNLNL
jgi:hypothetical protein